MKFLVMVLGCLAVFNTLVFGLESKSQFEDPFLIVFTTIVIERPISEVKQSLRQFFAPNFAGKLPKVLSQPDQVAALGQCSSEKCLLKLNAAKEVRVLEKVAKDKRREKFLELILARTRIYEKHGELLGYEDRNSNCDSVEKMLSLAKNYLKNPPAEFPKNGGKLREDILELGKGKLQPI